MFKKKKNTENHKFKKYKKTKLGCQSQGPAFLSFSRVKLDKGLSSFPAFYLVFCVISQFQKPFALHSKSAKLFILCSSPRSKCPVNYMNRSQQNLTTPEIFIFHSQSSFLFSFLFFFSFFLISSMVNKARVSIIS